MSGAILELADVGEKRRIEDSADVVIVGSGAAGATAARVLTEAGLDVIVIEEGPHVRTEELRSDMWTGFKRVWRDAGFQVAQGRAFTPVLQGRCVGGTTAINGAIIHRMPEAIHARWEREYGVGSALPYRELDRIWDRLDAELGVGPAPEPVLGDNNRLMRLGAERVGIRGNLIRRNVVDCQGSAHCNQGCPTARRQSMNVSYVPRAVERGARVYATCQARRITRRGGRAVGVRGRFVDPLTGRHGPDLLAHARCAVLVAASAIQTPLLLAENGVGRRSGVLGRRLQAHPGSAIVARFDQPVRMWQGATQGYESTHYWDERMKFETVAMPLELAAARLPGFGAPLMQRLADYDHLAVWGVQVRAEAHGSVGAGLLGGPSLVRDFPRASIRYDMKDTDVAVLKLGLYRLAELAFAAGAREVMPGLHGLPESVTSLDALKPIFDLPNDPRIAHCICAHLFGTALMGASPSSSVVKPSLEAHDLDALYVIDSSVFPTNLGVNPQHTISAIAWLTAERLAGA